MCDLARQLEILVKTGEVDRPQARARFRYENAQENVVEYGGPAREERLGQRVHVDDLVRDEITQLQVGVGPDGDEMGDETELAEQDGFLEDQTEDVGRDGPLVESLHELVIHDHLVYAQHQQRSGRGHRFVVDAVVDELPKALLVEVQRVDDVLRGQLERPRLIVLVGIVKIVRFVVVHVGYAVHRHPGGRVVTR